MIHILYRIKSFKNRNFRNLTKNLKIQSQIKSLCTAHTPNEKDAMTSRCLDRKEVRRATWRVHSTGTDRPVETGRLFLTFGGLVCADRISNCPLDTMYERNKKIFFSILVDIFFIILHK